MKNTIKIIGIVIFAIIIGFSFISCDNGSGGKSNTGGNTGGNTITETTLTITGLGDYNGKWVFAWGETSSDFLFAANSVVFDEEEETLLITCGQISNGSVTLKVLKEDDGSFIPFTRAGKVEMAILVSSQDPITEEEYYALEGNPEEISWLEAVGLGEVTFSAGKGTIAFEAIDMELW